MAATPTEKKSRTLLIGGIVGALLTALVGWICLGPAGDGLTRLSYDLGFDIGFNGKKKQVPEELIMVYLDETVKRNLGEPVDVPLNRRYYSKLLDRLTQDGARLVFFDILFDEPAADTATDAEFAAALHRNGHVVLVGGYERVVQANFQTDAPVPPTAILSSAAVWGVAKCPVDPDYSIRCLVVGTVDEPSAGWVAASLLGVAATNIPQAQLASKWLNYYYCPPGQLRAVNLDQTLSTNTLPAGYFHDKIVVIGARPEAGVAGDKREIFRTPYSLVGWADAPGPAVQGINLLNLARGDWLSRLPSSWETLLVIGWGIIIGLGLLAFRPWQATLLAVVCFGLIAGLAVHGHNHWLIWFAWLVPAGIQLPFALVWSVGYRYLVADQRRRQLRRAFGSYLSPFMADQIANSEFDLELGGKEVEASVMFTDLEGFTKMSESRPPSEVSKILVAYFNQTTGAILEQDGTIIKYIGDAVMAVWGAPLPEKRHAQRAVLAAWLMSQAGKKEIEGHRLRTRIGVNTGIVLSGNLGSKFRFDYTCIGDTTNFAARLEGLNKYLGTDILISEFTARELDGSIKLRPLGSFIVAGKKKAIGIFEVLGPAKDFPQDAPWFTEFAAALKQFQTGDLAAAETGFRQTITQRGGKDGPADFYLKQIAKLRAAGINQEAWDGAVRLDEK